LEVLGSHLLLELKDCNSELLNDLSYIRKTMIETAQEVGATIVGDLTMNGVTRPVTIAAEFTGAGANPMSKKETIGFEGTTTINRSEFGLSTFVPMVSDEVELTISAAFEKQ